MEGTEVKAVVQDIYFNTISDPARSWTAPTREPLAFHKRLPGYAPTPLVSLPHLAEHLGVANVWIKDESNRLGLPAFKILGASWATYRALADRFGSDVENWSRLDELRDRINRQHPLALVCATDGNHGRAVARMGALLGIATRVFMPRGTSPARIVAIESEGAEVTVVDGTYDDAVSHAAEEATQGNGRHAHRFLVQDTALSNDETIPRWIVEGYSTLFWEVDDALRAMGEPDPTLIIVQIGVGALADSVVRHYRSKKMAHTPRIVGVEPLRSACALASALAGRLVTIPGPHDSIMAGLNCGTPSQISWPTLMNGVDCLLAISDDRAREGMRVLADAGIVSGETGAAGIGGLLELLSGDRRTDARRRLGINHSTRVLIFSTEGATDPDSYERIVGHPPRAQ